MSVTTVKKIRLPNKPSNLLKVALEDLKKIERMKKKYRVDMSEWHRPNSHCAVCLAGAVMTRKFAPDEVADPDDFDDQTSRKLFALNYLRIGNIHMSLWELGIKYECRDHTNIIIKNKLLPRYFDVTQYEENRKQWHQDMKKLIKILQTAKL